MPRQDPRSRRRAAYARGYRAGLSGRCFAPFEPTYDCDYTRGTNAGLRKRDTEVSRSRVDAPSVG